MRLGLFRDIIDIQQDSGAAGDEAPTYTGTPKLLDVPCAITDVSGNETYRGRQLEAHVQYAIEMHFTTGIKPTMQVYVRQSTVWAGRTLRIEHVQPLLTNGIPFSMLLFCTEVPS